ncbi:MAG: tetratricopeptide repeat protein, partial [Chloroflexota bacterium]
MRQLHIAILGSPKLYFVETEPIILRSRKALAIFIYLAVQGGMHSRHSIAGLFWNDLPEANGLRNLRGELYKLGDLRPYLLADRRMLGINPQAPITLDYNTFCSYVSLPQPSLEQLNEAISLYRGLFLENFTISGAPQFEEWLTSCQSWCQLKLTEAMMTIGRHALYQRQWEQGLAMAERVLAIDPLFEEAHRLQMALLAEAGRRSEAVARFDSLALLLEKELGTSPDDETFELIQRIEGGQFTRGDKGNAAPFLVPKMKEQFVGREAEIRHLGQQLRERQGNVHVIAGMGGIGKTTLAIHTAHAVQNHFRDGVLWADARSDPHQIIDNWTRRFGYDFSLIADLEQKAAAMREAFTNKELLLILDNVESVARIDALLPKHPSCPVLLTTRSVNEAVETLQPRILTLDTLSEEQSVDLLVNYLGERRVLGDREAAEQLCMMTEQLPLALEIVGRRLSTQAWRAMPLSGMVARLGDARQKMSELAVADLAVRSSFEVSWASLSQDLQMVFAGTAVFAGRSFAVPALAYILQQTDFSAEDKLLALLALSLVQRENGQRFRQHALLADYALSKLTDNSAWQRMSDYFVTFAETAEEDYRPLAPEWDNLLAGMTQAHQTQQHETTMRYGKALAKPWGQRAKYKAAQQGAGMALKAAYVLEEAETIATFHDQLGRVEQRLGNYEAAENHLRRAKAIWASETQDRAQGITGLQLGRVLMEVSRSAEAEIVLKEALDKFEALKDLEGQATALYGLARLIHMRHANIEGLSLAKKALQIQRQLPSSRHRIRTINLIGEFLLDLQDYTKAADYFEEAYQLGKQLEDLDGIASTLMNLASLYRVRGQLEKTTRYVDKARTYANESLDVHRKYGKVRSVSITY